jgi:uncharacterized repeat protein (TIGR01451 family)
MRKSLAGLALLLLSSVPAHAQWLLVTGGAGTECIDQVETMLTARSQTYVTEIAALAGARSFADLEANFDYVWVAVETCGTSPLSDATFQASINGGALEQWLEAGGIMAVNAAHNASADYAGPAGSLTYGHSGTGDTDGAPTIVDANHDYIVGTFSSGNTLVNADFAGWSTTSHGQVAPPAGFTSSGGTNLGTSPTPGQYNVLLTGAAGSSTVTHQMIEFTPGAGYVLLDLMTFDWGPRPPNEAMSQMIDYLIGIEPNFGTVIQFDPTSVFNADVVVNNGGGDDVVQDAMDGDNNAYTTQSFSAAEFPTDPDGLPDDAFFPAGAGHPNVQLHWSNDDNGNNARRSANAVDNFTIDILDGTYESVHIFGATGDGDAQLTVTFNYSDVTTSQVSVTIPDWFNAPTSPVYQLIGGLDRAETDASVHYDDDGAQIFGAELGVDDSKTLVSITIDRTDTSGIFAFFGAVGLIAQNDSDLSITKTAMQSAVYPGDTITYEIVVSNAGPDAADNVIMTDPLPANTTFVSISEPAGFDCDTPAVGAGGIVTCTAASLAASTDATFTLVIRLDEDAAQGTLITNSASVTGDVDDPDAANDAATAAAVPAVISEIPTASEWGLLAIMMALAAVAILKLR